MTPHDHRIVVKDAPCEACGGYGDIWTGWHPTPARCGVCHGTGETPTPAPEIRARLTEETDA